MEYAKQMMAAHIEDETAELESTPIGVLFQHQHDALLSFIYNVGFGAFTKSTFYQQILARGLILESWLNYTHDGHGNVLPGLVERRHRELALFIYGDY